MFVDKLPYFRRFPEKFIHIFFIFVRLSTKNFENKTNERVRIGEVIHRKTPVFFVFRRILALFWC